MTETRIYVDFMKTGAKELGVDLVVLNAELVVAPMECIDYVIIHELSHAVVLDHGPEFYNLLSRRLPRWRDLKNELEGHSIGFSPLIL